MKATVLGLLMFLGLSFSANAAHIDELGINITLVSSDGNGNFSVLYEEYFGADGWMWGRDNPNLWNADYRASVSASLAQGPGTLSNPGNFFATFDGITDLNANETLGFGTSQINMHFVNDTTDAARYSKILDFTITGFDRTQSYLVDVSANDCCYVVGSGSTSFNGQLQFDITQVVGVPEPTTLGLMLLATFGLFGRQLRKK
ncbi:PEP-CTERM protein-sorting domain-containing protein [Colwellia chukchiensis]|uniref:PEP-CTERM protein-sorting domain-containing protein n=1 Tax=Colwellia chukchiensis TaxID=641665 RepID=A0A1H7NAT4_9GAMM|nr:PEP-CTERM sorting domain-containing protein [Colwellia chukchiensis]SEL20431.1 PEP-CTERM protein-sorting domain-containing protein [Colwellia chukchiensis]